MSAFIESQFSYCPLLWMFCSKAMNDKINSIHKRALQIVYLDYTSSFNDLLKRDGSVTVHQRNIRLLAIEMFKVIRGLGPETMRTLFSFDYSMILEVPGHFLDPVSALYIMGKIRFDILVLWCGMTCSLKDLSLFRP